MNRSLPDAKTPQAHQKARPGSLGPGLGVWLPGLILALWVLLALLASVLELAPHRVDLGAILAPPGSASLLGNDDLGRPVWDRLLVGAQVSLIVGFGVVGVSAVLGTLVGALAGFAGGPTRSDPDADHGRLPCLSRHPARHCPGRGPGARDREPDPCPRGGRLGGVCPVGPCPSPEPDPQGPRDRRQGPGRGARVPSWAGISSHSPSPRSWWRPPSASRRRSWPRLGYPSWDSGSSHPMPPGAA